jgi:molecular chaperone GrpE
MSAEAELALLTAELAVTRRERDEYLDGLRRLKAEFDNSRKRMDRERERIFQTASERIVSELLPVLDNLERALEAEGDVREGVRVTRDQLADVLEREGLVPIDSDGEAFDPSVHEAVMGQPSDEHEEGTILQTFERGYVLNGRAIRPAKVVVARQG